MSLYYDAGSIQLWHARCEDTLPTLEAASIDLILTDPCYGTTQLDWDVLADWPSLWPALYRVCKPSALQVMFSQQPFTTDLINSNRKRFRYDLVWPKTMPTGFLDANRRPLRAHETVLVFAETFGGSTYHPQKMPSEARRKPHTGAPAGHYGKYQEWPTTVYTDRLPTSVLPSFSNSNSASHETAKPLDLISWLILTYSNPGDLVLDPFLGSGSTSEACKILGRRCIGIEVREQPLTIARRRLFQEVMQFEVSP